MATYSKEVLSGSTNGRPIEVTGTTSPGTTIHTVGATATSTREEVHLWVFNRATSDSLVQIEFGGTASADKVMANIPPQDGAYSMIPGWVLTATSSIVYAIATATGRVMVGGFVNRIV